MNEPGKYQELMWLILQVINKFSAMEKEPRYFGTEEKLYSREIHTIQAIGNYPVINVTDLASKLGITKGTISPIVTKLAEKKLVLKFKGGDNNKEILLRLTPKGEVAYYAHEMFERQFLSRKDCRATRMQMSLCTLFAMPCWVPPQWGILVCISRIPIPNIKISPA